MNRVGLIFAIVAIACVSRGDDALPAEARLGKLNRQYAEAKDRALMPVRNQYLLELRALKDRFTKAGRFDDALKVESEITQLLGGKDPGSPLVQILTSKKWTIDHPAKWFQFSLDGKATGGNGKDYAWRQISDDEIIILQETKSFYFKWNEGQERFEGSAINGDLKQLK